MVGIPGFSCVTLILAVGIVTNYAVVLGNHKAAELVDNRFCKGFDLGAAGPPEKDILHYHLAGCIFQGDGTVGKGYAQSTLGGLETDGFVKTCGMDFHLPPVGFHHPITVEQGLRETVLSGNTDTEDIILAELHGHSEAII